MMAHLCITHARCTINVPFCVKQAGHIHLPYGEKANEYCNCNQITLLFWTSFNQSLNDEYMNDAYKTNIYGFRSSLWVKTMVPQ